MLRVIKTVAITLTLTLTAFVGSVSCGDGDANGTPPPQRDDAVGQPKSEYYEGPAPPTQRQLAPGDTMYGNCLVPGLAGAARQVIPLDGAPLKGGLVFEDSAGTRYYSFPSGRCLVLMGAADPPDWVPPQVEATMMAPLPTPLASPTR